MANFRSMFLEIILTMEKIKLVSFRSKLRPPECTQSARSRPAMGHS